jgi:hypothetical protein
MIALLRKLPNAVLGRWNSETIQLALARAHCEFRKNFIDFAGREIVQELRPIKPEGVVGGTNSRISACAIEPDLRTDIVAYCLEVTV